LSFFFFLRFKGSSKIEIIYLEFPSSEEEVIEWKGDELKKMQNLKTLIVKNGSFSKGLKYLPNSLRVLEWHKYPSRVMPSDFFPKKLSICKLQQSDFISFGLHGTMKVCVNCNDFISLILYTNTSITILIFIHSLILFLLCCILQRFVNMRELNLDHCRYLTRIHDVSNLPNLEIFSFQFCKNLIEIHKSVGFLNKLQSLHARFCSNLLSFPPLKSTSLRGLELSFCFGLQNFPEILGEMKNITHITFEQTSISKLPDSFQNLTGLRSLSIEGFGRLIRLPSSIFRMPNLSNIFSEDCLFPKKIDKLSSMVLTSPKGIKLKKCNLSDEFLPILVMWSANVEWLDLSGNNFTILPECIKDFQFLSSLTLDDCKCLREIRGIPPNLKYLSTKYCKSLTSSCRNMLLNQVLFCFFIFLVFDLI